MKKLLQSRSMMCTRTYRTNVQICLPAQLVTFLFRVVIPKKWADGESHRPNTLRSANTGGGRPAFAKSINNWGIKDRWFAQNHSMGENISGIRRPGRLSP
jgi:hypothetical protein